MGQFYTVFVIAIDAIMIVFHIYIYIYYCLCHYFCEGLLTAAGRKAFHTDLSKQTKKWNLLVLTPERLRGACISDFLASKDSRLSGFERWW